MIRDPHKHVVDTVWRRRRMVEEQLCRRGIVDARVLAAMRTVPREEFAPADLRHAAYDDRPLPIGYEQTISQPFTVAFMCEALQLRGDEKVLEIGAGSGYGAAVLSQLCAEVFTIERIPQLAQEGRQRLKQLGYETVHVITGDGTMGLPDEAPFDGIVVTAGAATLPNAYARQLRDGGRIIIPIGPLSGGQTMYRFTRHGNELKADDLGCFSFVPLIGEGGRSPLVDDSFAQ